MHKLHRPWYIRRRVRIEFESAVQVDNNPLCVPDVIANLLESSAVKSVAANAFDTIIPMYIIYNIYGESWRKPPNQVLVDIAVKALRVGGRIVMAPAKRFFDDEDDEDDEEAFDRDALTHGFYALLDIQVGPLLNYNVVFDAYMHSRQNMVERVRVRTVFMERFPGAHDAIAFMEKHVPVTRKRSVRYVDMRTKMSTFSNAIEHASNNQLRRIVDDDLVYASDECVVVFQKHISKY
jgi:hypothetical protein